jgi:LacI family transcriptional regulator
MPKPPHVALLVESSHGYGRDLLSGIIRYVNEHGPWSVYFRPQGLEAAPPLWLRDWRGDGILVRVEDQAMAEAVWRSGIPAVNLRVPFPEFPLPIVGLDNLSLGGPAFQHLADCGLQHFAFCGTVRGEYPWLDEREDSFVEAVRAAGRQCHLFLESGHRPGFTWEEQEDLMADWVRALPKPVGIMACNDDRGLELLEACHRADVLVPEDVAVIGVDDDVFVCQLSNPPMSSISANAQRIGREAAALLARMMDGASPPSEPILLPPGGVVARQSTDVLATEDRELAKAIRYIREHACEGLRVNELAQVTRLSYKNLERRMRKLLGRTPKEEISRVQIETAKRLLLETDFSAAAISARCGFVEPKYFHQVFRAKVGLPPGSFRQTRTQSAR